MRMSLDAIREYGANVQEGLGRCINNEQFYLRMIGLALEDGNFSKLENAVRSGDKKEAFEAAHALKGVLGNLALTPMYTPVAEMTELLRKGQEADYAAYITEIAAQRERLRAIMG